MYTTIRNAVLWFVVSVGLVVCASTNIIQAQQSCQAFPETGWQVCGRMLEYWQQNGALSVFGYPISNQSTQVIEGRQIQVQLFEPNRLELHAENPPPYDVL